ncbi:hypothetical protein V6N13_014308 [Hibiscus sabdariffa]|uniref:Uncharacterized protein n=1 Tax=Hibiscus sabdariffa TaxID=183260 RepID=A0ABR2RVQ3_9ROSI
MLGNQGEQDPGPKSLFRHRLVHRRSFTIPSCYFFDLGSRDQFDRSSAQPSLSHSIPLCAPVVTCSCTVVEHSEVGAQ